MASQTLLEMTQNILASMGSDEVNSIGDTTESQIVVRIIKDSYNYLLSSIDLNEHYTFFELEPSGDPAYPQIMHLPANCDELLWLRYNTFEVGDSFSENDLLEYLELNDFMSRMLQFDADDITVQESDIIVNEQEITTRWYSDRQPSCYTTFNDRTVLFDACDLTVDTTLQKSKSLAWGKLNPTFVLADTFIPVLNQKHFSLLFNEAKAQSFIELKQQANPVAERRARKGWIRTQKQKDSVVDPYENYRSLPGYGRRGYGYRSNRFGP